MQDSCPSFTVSEEQTLRNMTDIRIQDGKLHSNNCQFCFNNMADTYILFKITLALKQGLMIAKTVTSGTKNPALVFQKISIMCIPSFCDQKLVKSSTGSTSTDVTSIFLKFLWKSLRSKYD